MNKNNQIILFIIINITTLNNNNSNFTFADGKNKISGL